MSRTIERTFTPDVLRAEPRTNGQRQRGRWQEAGQSNKVAVIPGASTGMGFATAKRFVQKGMDHVFTTARRKDALDVAVAEIGDKATGIPGDVASLNDLDRLYESVKPYGRKLDVAFANAGIAQLTPFGAVDEKRYDLHFDTNVKGFFFTAQRSLSLLNDGASIILTAWPADIKGFPGISVYSATKAAVRTWTNELRERCIRVNAISPGQYRYSDFRGLATGRRANKDERRAREKRSAWPAGRSRRNRQSRCISSIR
jgi:NAD(P)-dependent dehydrogenase (short-subunit alcohol dehydrogenase family)